MQQPGEDFIISPNTSYSLLMKDILILSLLRCVILEFPNEISFPPRKHPRETGHIPFWPKSWSSTLPAPAYPPSHPIGGRCLYCYLELIRSNQLAVANTLVRWRYGDFWCFTVKKNWDLPLRWLFGLAPAIETILDDFVWSYRNVNSMRLTYHKHSCIKEKCNVTYTDTVPLWACYRDRKNTHATAYFSKLGRSVAVNTCTHWRIPAIYTLKVSKQNQTSNPTKIKDGTCDWPYWPFNLPTGV